MRKHLLTILLVLMSSMLFGQIVSLTSSKPVRMVRPESGYSVFVKAYVENAIDEWQRKQPGESNARYKNRVSESHKQEMIVLLEAEASDKYLQEISRTYVLDLNIDGYDRNNEQMIMSENYFGRLSVKVPVVKSDYFISSWSDIVLKPDYFIYKDTLGLAKVDFMLPDGSRFQYINKGIIDSMYMGLPYMLSPVYIFGERVRNGVDEKNHSIDKDIPVMDSVNKNTWVVIIANENYRKEPKVKFAKNDAETFKNYCIKTLCVPKRNLKFVQNATLKDFEIMIKWMSGVAKQYGEETKFIIYYVGHGISSNRNKKSYFVPVEGRFSKIKTCFSVDYFFENLSAMPVKSAVVFVDASFNCYNRKGTVLVDDITSGIKSKTRVLDGNVVACFAAQGNETAFQYEDKKHGVFTYFLLKEIQNNPSNLTLGGLFYEVQSKVKTYSLSEFKKTQTPSVIYSSRLTDKWKDIKLR